MANDKEVVPEMPPPTATIPITKDQAKEVRVSEKIKIIVEGYVEGISQSYRKDELFMLTLKNIAVSGVSVNKADRALKEIQVVDE